jgi:multidrug transporter EmrE-like cation transporter
VAAVVASQYAAMLVVIGCLALGERLGRWQAVGVGVVLAGVAVLAAVQA